MRKDKPSICFDCENGYAHKCKWVAFKIPVKGWKAEKREYHEKSGSGFTYSVSECPNFIADATVRQGKHEYDDLIINISKCGKYTLRQIADMVGVSSSKVYKVLQNQKGMK